MGLLVSGCVALKHESPLYPDCLLIKGMISFAIIIFRQHIYLTPSFSMFISKRESSAFRCFVPYRNSPDLVPDSCCFKKGQRRQTQLHFYHTVMVKVMV